MSSFGFLHMEREPAWRRVPSPLDSSGTRGIALSSSDMRVASVPGCVIQPGAQTFFYSAGLWAERSGFDSRWRLGIFLFTIASRTAPGPIQPPIQWVPGAHAVCYQKLNSSDYFCNSPPVSYFSEIHWQFRRWDVGRARNISRVI
jgi:hypothetical protein